MTTVQLSTDEQVADAKAAASEANPNQKPAAQSGERPAWLPEKFKSPEEMAKAYGELEKKQSQGKKPDEQTQQQDQQQQQGDPVVFSALKNVGLDPNKFSGELLAQGKLSEASYAELAGKGFPKAVVDQYIRGAQAEAAQSQQQQQQKPAQSEADKAKDDLEFSTIMTQIGNGDTAAGTKAFQTATAWAAEALTDAEMEAYNGMVSSKNPEVRKQGANWLIEKYSAANPNKPKLLNVNSSGVASGEVYTSDAEVTAAVRNPLYKKSPAFRAEHAAKLQRSKNILTGAQYRLPR
jgi:hypothetical protein